jgi:hypothetical protein
VQTLIVDGSMDVNATVAAVEELFAEAIAEGPCAETRSERQALLREANRAIAVQVRGYYARTWAHSDAKRVVRDFFCECGNITCDASVHVPRRRCHVRTGACPGAPLTVRPHRPTQVTNGSGDQHDLFRPLGARYADSIPVAIG